MKININCSVHIKEEIERLITEVRSFDTKYSDVEKQNLVSRVHWILEALFKNEYGSFSVPWDFIDSEVGRHLLMIKYRYGGVSNLMLAQAKQLFSTVDVAIIRGVTRQSIDAAIRSGAVNAMTSGKNLFITRIDLIVYLTDKYKIAMVDAESIVQFFEELTSRDVPMEEELLRERMKECVISYKSKRK